MGPAVMAGPVHWMAMHTHTWLERLIYASQGICMCLWLILTIMLKQKMVYISACNDWISKILSLTYSQEPALSNFLCILISALFWGQRIYKNSNIAKISRYKVLEHKIKSINYTTTHIFCVVIDNLYNTTTH